MPKPDPIPEERIAALVKGFGVRVKASTLACILTNGRSCDGRTISRQLRALVESGEIMRLGHGPSRPGVYIPPRP